MNSSLQLSSAQKYVWIFGHQEFLWSPGLVIGETDTHFKTQSVDDGQVYEVAKTDAKFIPQTNLNSEEPDLIHLNQLDQGTLLRTVRQRYSARQIYTAIGNSVLIAVNPYERIKKLYSEETQKYYHTEMSRDQFKVDPHLYVIAESAFQEMERTDKNQAIIVSGESGAGKTESTKILLKYLAWVARQGAGMAVKPSSKLKQKEEMKQPHHQITDIEELTLRANPMLEAFGNAKTVRNDNSSRFGKFIEVRFMKGKGLHSAQIVNYLLEKSRIVNQAEDQRNFHIFYQLCAGLSAAEREHLKLKQIYEYKCTGLCFNIDGVDDAQEFQATKECFVALGFDSQQMMRVFELVVGILNMSNVEFEDQYKVGQGDIAQLDGDQSQEALGETSRLLGIELSTLDSALKTATKKIGKDVTIMIKNAVQATDARNSICKVVYDRMFSWLIRKVNGAMRGKKGVSEKSLRVVGLLDIFGFEIFEKNSFEQLCINYANEKLQQFFNDVIFHLEQEIYMKEKIQWSHITISDNLKCIKMIENSSNSLFKLLNDECKMKKSDLQLVQMFYSSLGSDYSKNLKKERDNNCFRVQHYAGGVVYDVNGFCEKNIDKVDDSILQCLAMSSNPIMQELFGKGKAFESSGKAPPKSISIQFKEQLATLMKILGQSQPKFVRCIKPNAHKKPSLFESIDVNRQLQYSGVLETVKIRRAGYPVRKDYQEFIKRYSIFLKKGKAGASTGKKDFKAKAQDIFASMKQFNKKFWNLSDPAELKWQTGITRVFMKYEVNEGLEVCLGICLNQQITKFQALWKKFKWRRWFLKLKEGTTRIKKFWKVYLRYQKFRKQIKLTRLRAIELKRKIYKQFRVFKLARGVKRRIELRRIILRKIATQEQFGQERGLKGLEVNMIQKREEEIREAKRRAEEKKRLEEQKRKEAQKLKEQQQRQKLQKLHKEEQDRLDKERIANQRLENERIQKAKLLDEKQQNERKKKEALEEIKVAKKAKEKPVIEDQTHHYKSVKGSKRPKYEVGDGREERKAEKSVKKLSKYDLERIRREQEEQDQEEEEENYEEEEEPEEWRMQAKQTYEARSKVKSRSSKHKSKRSHRSIERGLSQIHQVKESESEDDIYERELDSSLAMLLRNISPDIKRESLLRLARISKIAIYREFMQNLREAGKESSGLNQSIGDASIWRQWRESKKRADELEVLNLKLKEEQGFLNSTIEELKFQNEELSKLKEKIHEKISEDSQDLIKLQNELEDKNIELVGVKEENEDYKEIIKQLQDDNEKLRMELDLLRKESSISVNIASDKLGELETGIEERKKENDYLKRMAKKHESAAQTLAKQVKDMKSQLQFLSEELNHRDNEYKEQKMLADKSQIQIKALNQELDKLRATTKNPDLSQNFELEQSMLEGAPSPRGVQKQSEKLQEYVKSVKDEMLKLKNENKELNECMSDLSGNLESANMVNARLREQLQLADKKVQSLKTKIHDSKKSFQGVDRVLYSLLLIQRKKNYSDVFRSSKEFQIFSNNERKLWKALREELASEGKKKPGMKEGSTSRLARVTELANQETLHE